MDVIIRKIEESDYPAAARLLLDELFEGKFSGDYAVPFFYETKNNDDYVTFVAVSEDSVIGLISAITFLWAASDRKNMIIQGFVVKSEYRNKGIGAKLLKRMEDYADSKKMIGIGLCSGFQRTAAHAFYEKNGHSALTKYFGKMLNPINYMREN